MIPGNMVLAMLPGIMASTMAGATASISCVALITLLLH
jgi:hypothetical protein